MKGDASSVRRSMNEGTIEPGLNGPAIQKAQDNVSERGVGCAGEGSSTESQVLHITPKTMMRAGVN